MTWRHEQQHCMTFLQLKGHIRPELDKGCMLFPSSLVVFVRCWPSFHQFSFYMVCLSPGHQLFANFLPIDHLFTSLSLAFHQSIPSSWKISAWRFHPLSHPILWITQDYRRIWKAFPNGHSVDASVKRLQQ